MYGFLVKHFTFLKNIKELQRLMKLILIIK